MYELMKKYLQLLAPVLFIIAIGFTVLGLSDGGFADVLEKARVICYECIGIG
jgi:hypothetical protein